MAPLSFIIVATRLTVTAPSLTWRLPLYTGSSPASSACLPFLDTPADPRQIPGLFLSSPRLFSRSTGRAFWGRETATPL